MLCLLLAARSYAQTSDNTMDSGRIGPVNINEYHLHDDIKRQESIHGMYIYAGKKTEVIELTKRHVAIAEKFGRQIFAKVPGVFVYDMDGTGNQMNLAARGLDPHRSWEYNVRKDGVITNSDMYGYPASHYNIPMEAVERIELVRGTASLQYGAQFGGMLNYISKLPDTTRSISFETINTAGSFGLLSTYNRVSGRAGKFRYSAWMNERRSSGYRINNNSSSNAQGITLYYDHSEKTRFRMEWTRSSYMNQLPGPLTDSMFRLNPVMSTRFRNHYQPIIHVPSFTLNHQLRPNTKVQWTTSAVLGERNSVLFDRPATIADTLVTATLQYNHRQVDVDLFNSFTSELRVIHSYRFRSLTSTLAAGIQYMNNRLQRKQLGKGTTGSDFDLTIAENSWGRNLRFHTSNLAFFAENRLVLTKKWSVNPGFRIESGASHMSGTIVYYADSAIPNTIRHRFPLFGFSTQYDLNRETNIYAGWSQAYRPVIFKDIIPQSVFEVTDRNLKDARGFNTEIGFRGKRRFLSWDISAFYLRYNNRLGTLARQDSNQSLQILRTNIGNSRNFGLECFIQADLLLSKHTDLTVFSSLAWMDARYIRASIRNANMNISIHRNRVESAPSWISRNGFTISHKSLSFSALHSYTSSTFADALNSVNPSVNGATGIVPAYALLDVNLCVRITQQLKVQLNINNLLNESYFTKRPQFYPGPGIWPSDGRSFSGTVMMQLR